MHIPHEKHQKLDKKTFEYTYLGYSEHKRAFILVHQSSGRIMESWDVHFDKSKLVEPTRVRMETEISQNKEKMENLPVKRKKQAESDSDSSVDFQEPPDGESDDDDDGYDSETLLEGYGTAGSSGSNARPSTAPDNDENHNNRSKTIFHAMLTSQTKSGTSKTPKTMVTHLRNMQNLPTNSYQVPSVQPEELCHSTRIQRVPVPDDDNRYSRTSYGSCSAHKSAGETSVTRGEARGCDEGGNVTQVTNVTESANTTILGDPVRATESWT